METAEYIVILKSGHRFRMFRDSVVSLWEKMKKQGGALPWHTFEEDGSVQYMFSLHDVEAIVKEKYLVK